jgi:hypothetical protein
MCPVVVCDQENLENEEAKARYWAVENTTIIGCNGTKTTTNFNVLLFSGMVSEEHRNVMVMLCVLASMDVCICLLMLLGIIQTSIVYVIII